jgi:RND family efflux transporter MFP subunit
MAESERASILSWVRRLTAEAGVVSDAQLLDRFVANRDEAAFELLLRRHARMVFEVCRRVLRDPHDAEDAFQATFLALARHADRIAKREAIASWLHQVAYRTALTARGRRARRASHEKLSGAAEHLSVAADAVASSENQELRRVLDQEIGRLPERLRAAVVLCYLDGKSVDEAALLLGCPRGTVASRLARGRERLRVRLTRRGLTLTAALASFTQGNAASGPLALIPTLTAATLRYKAKGAAAPAALSPRITALTEEVLRAMFLHKVKTGILVLMAFVGILLVGSGLAHGLRANSSPEAEPPGKGEVFKAQAAGQEEKAGDKPSAKAPHPVTVSRPVRREAAPYQIYTGRLEARQSVEVRPAVSGFVQKVCFKAGAEVQKGDVLFELDSRAAQLTVDKAKAQLALVEAKKKQSEIERNNAKALLANKTISSGEFDRISWQVAAAEAAVKLAEIELDRARLELEATKVTAPMSGRVGRPLVDAGSLVFRGQDRATLLTTVTALDPIGLTFNMAERAFLDYQRSLREKKVKGEGSSLRIRLTGEEEFAHEGTLESLEDHISPETGTVRVHGSFPNSGLLLRPGMSILIRITLGPPRAVLEIPEEALFSVLDRKYVFVVNESNIVQQREVTLGPDDNDMRIIEKGLGEKDWVVIAGLGNLRPGDRVEPRKKSAPKPSDPDRDQDHGPATGSRRQ